MRTALDDFVSSLPVTAHASSVKTAPGARGRRDTKCGTGVTLTDTAKIALEGGACGRQVDGERGSTESALLYVAHLDREFWIASDRYEAARLREELTKKGDNRPVVLADDVARLREQPRELIDASVLALAVLGGKLSRVGPALHETSPKSSTSELKANNTADWTGEARDIAAGARGPRAASLVTELPELREIAEPKTPAAEDRQEMAKAIDADQHRSGDDRYIDGELRDRRNTRRSHVGEEQQHDGMTARKLRG